MKLTKEEVNKKYRDRYITITKSYDYQNQCWMYEVGKTFREIHENTTLGQDVGTSLEYMR